MRNLNLEVFTNWVVTTSEIETLKLFRDQIAERLVSVSPELIESIPVAKSNPEAGRGSFNGRGILQWIESIGTTPTETKKDGTPSDGAVLVISVYKLILTRLNKKIVVPVGPALAEETIKSASEVIAKIQDLPPTTDLPLTV
jgi:hypothetical protein